MIWSATEQQDHSLIRNICNQDNIYFMLHTRDGERSPLMVLRPSALVLSRPFMVTGEGAVEQVSTTCPGITQMAVDLRPREEPQPAAFFGSPVHCWTYDS